MKTLTINSITFQVITPRKQEIKDSYRAQFNNTVRYKNLNQVYKKPSRIKTLVWNEWYAWYSETKHDFETNFTYSNVIYGFGISGFNCNYFTLSFKLQYNGNVYLGIITKAKNRLIKIN